MNPATVEEAMAATHEGPTMTMVDKDGRRFHASGADVAGDLLHATVAEIGRRMFELPAADRVRRMFDR